MTKHSTPPHIETIIIGAGFSGIGLAIRLSQQGCDYMLLERANNIGGVWRDNTYPGAACDVPSKLYSFSFVQNSQWSRSFSTQTEILAYLNACADQHLVPTKIKLNQAVTAAEFGDKTGTWTVTTATGQVYTCQFLITACGQLCQPTRPKIAGEGHFRGNQFHSAQWQHDVDFTGQRVAVIGTGASAIQFVPKIAQTAAKVTVFQRTPPYILPKRDRNIGSVEQGLMKRIPALQNLIRKTIYSKNEFRAFYLGPLKAVLKLYSLRWKWFMHSQVKDLKKRALLTPGYVIGCKRILISNDFYSTLNEPHVNLVGDPLATLKEESVVTESGAEHHVDVVIFATGFKAADFLDGINIKGINGELLHERWRHGAFAHNGLTVSQFPNFLMCYGPNTNIGHNSMIHVLESQFNYICDYIKQVKILGLKYLDLKHDAESLYQEKLTNKLSNTVWQRGGCQSWYQNKAGKNTNNWPGLTMTYRLNTRRVKLNDFDQIS